LGRTGNTDNYISGNPAYENRFDSVTAVTITPAKRNTQYCTMRYAASTSVFEPVPSSGAKICDEEGQTEGWYYRRVKERACVKATCVVADGTTLKNMA
jgi:hypothetical protein